MTRVLLAPSILNADFGHLAEAVQAVEAGGADWLHVDVMDGAFVPNISLGPMVVEAIRRATRLPLDVHLMVQNPARYVADFRAAGADGLTIHLEADTHPHRTLGRIRELGARAGLALNPGTGVASAQDLAAHLDLLLVMSVNPGFGGQAFIPTSTEKVRRARRLLDAQQSGALLEVDGGVNPENAAGLVRAGATMLVAGSFVYADGAAGAAARLARLRGVLEGAAGSLA